MNLTSLRTPNVWKYPVRLIIVICGLFFYATGIVCMYRSDLGLDPWDVLHQGISRHTFLSFGTATIVVGVCIVLFSLLLKVYPGVGSLLNMVLVGAFADWQLRTNWLPDLSAAPLVLRLLVHIAGVFIIGMGTALYIAPHMGAGPRDGLMLRLHVLTKVRIAIVRVSIECSVLIIGFFLGGTVGIGTLIFALGVGPAVEASFSVVKKLRFIEQLRIVENDKPARTQSQPARSVVSPDACGSAAHKEQECL